MKLFLFLFSVIGLLFSSYLPGTAQSLRLCKPEDVGMSTERLSRIHPHFQSYLEEEKIAGIQTLVARKGKVVHFESNGYADMESKKMMDENAIFRIYSMTKPIVSVGLMMLFEEGKFQLDDPVSKFIPSFANLRAVVKDDNSGKTESIRQEMKIVDLLRHTSGLGYGWGAGTFVDSLYRARGVWREKDLAAFVDKVAEVPLYFQPGTHWRYGISTDIVGRLVEVIADQPLDTYLQERIFDPLKMENTFFQVPKEKIQHYTTHYRPKEGGGIEVADHPSTSAATKEVSFFSGGGGLQGTTHDYYRFCQMLLNGGELEGVRLLSPKTIELMTVDHTAGITHGGGPLVYPNKFKGFGLGFSVTRDLASAQNLDSEGAYGWGGAAGTYFIVDPKEELILIQMIQLRPYNHLNHRREFHTLVYQAIVE